MKLQTLSVVVGAVLGVAACTAEDATPIDELPPLVSVATAHALEPTDEMLDLATQQCLDDPELEVGEIKAIDPADEGRMLVEVAVPCDEVR